MRVLHAIPSLAPRHGGPTEAALGMVRALRADGIDARILTSDDDGGARLPVPLRSWTDFNGVPCLFLPRIPMRQRGTLTSYTYTPGFNVWLKQHVGDFDFVHVHSVFSHTSNAAMRVARRRGIPACIRPLGQLCGWSLQQRALVKRLHLLAEARRNIDGTSFIHCTSQMEAEETAELGFRSPCLVLPHGLDLPPIVADAKAALRAELGVPSDGFIAAFMSRFHPKKGLELLIDACAESSCRIELVLAGMGDPEYVAALEARISERGLTGRVHWHGFVEGERKWRLLQGSDVFVLPSHSENFAISVLEALACGLPAIVSDQVALKDEISAEQVGLVVPRDAGALAQALQHFLDAGAQRKAASDRARRLVQDRFTWPVMAGRLVEAYRCSIDQRGGRPDAG